MADGDPAACTAAVDAVLLPLLNSGSSLVPPEDVMAMCSELVGETCEMEGEGGMMMMMPPGGMMGGMPG